MAIPTSLAGTSVPPLLHRVDERWTMAYAAAVGDDLPAYFDTTAPDGVVGHPMFAVCLEWPVIVQARTASETFGISRDQIRTSVHATHDLTIHPLIRPGDELRTSLKTTGLVNIKPGAMSTTRLETVDGDGRSVATTIQNGIYLGVPATGEDRPDPSPPAPIAGTERRGEPDVFRVPLPSGAAHTYTECARIWNPIHTDRAVAIAAGLPDIILHGTANLAYGVSAVVRERAKGRPEMVRRVTCRFRAMVPLPSTIEVRIWPSNEAAKESGVGRQTVPFEVVNAEGTAAVSDGLIVLGESIGS